MHETFREKYLKLFILTCLANLLYCQAKNLPQNFESSTVAVANENEQLNFTSTTKTEQQQRLGFLISSTFLNCSANCSAISDCIGVTIYKRSETNSTEKDTRNTTEVEVENNNRQNPSLSSDTNTDADDIFWCKMDLDDNPEDLAKGNVVYKVMFRDKLKKVWRLPLLYRNHRESKGRERKRFNREVRDREDAINQNHQSTVLDIHLHPDPDNHVTDDTQEGISSIEERHVLASSLTNGLPNPELAQFTIQKGVPALVESEEPQQTILVTIPNRQAISNLSQATQLIEVPNMKINSNLSHVTHVANVTNLQINSNLSQGTHLFDIPNMQFSNLSQGTHEVNVPNSKINTDLSQGTHEINVPNLQINTDLSQGTHEINVPNLQINTDLSQGTHEINVPNLQINTNLSQGTHEVNVPNLEINTDLSQETHEVNVPNLEINTNLSQGTNLIDIPNMVEGSQPQNTVFINISSSPITSITNTSSLSPVLNVFNTDERIATTTERLTPTLIPDESKTSTTFETTTNASFVEVTTEQLTSTLLPEKLDTSTTTPTISRNDTLIVDVTTENLIPTIFRGVSGDSANTTASNIIFSEITTERLSLTTLSSGELVPSAPTATSNDKLFATTTKRLIPTFSPGELDESTTIETTSAAQPIEVAVKTTPKMEKVKDQNLLETTELPLRVRLPVGLLKHRLGLKKPVKASAETQPIEIDDRIIFREEPNHRPSTTTLKTTAGTETETDTEISTSEEFLPSTTERQELNVTTTVRSIPTTSGKSEIPNTTAFPAETATTKVNFDILVSPPLVPSSIQIKVGQIPEIKVDLEPRLTTTTEKVTAESPPKETGITESINVQVDRVEKLLEHTFSSISSLLTNLIRSVSFNKKAQQCEDEDSFGKTNQGNAHISNHSENFPSLAVPEPSSSELLEGEHGEDLEFTEIPPPLKEEILEITVAPFPILRPKPTTTTHGPPIDSLAEGDTTVNDTNHGTITHLKEPETNNVPQRSDRSCLLTDDKERFKRDMIATAFSILDDVPTMLSFVNGSSCVGTFRKKGQKSVQHMKQLFPDFPIEETQIVAGAFYNNTVYLFDSEEEQMVWSFFYDTNIQALKAAPQPPMTVEVFMKKICGIPGQSHFNIKAIAQFSQTDNSCILFDTSGNIFISPDASEDAILLARAILYVVQKEFVRNVKSVFAWLDDSFVSKVYVFGSNSEVYEIYRDETTNFKWMEGVYRIVPYEVFPR